MFINEYINKADMKWNDHHPVFHDEGKRPILKIVSDEEAFEYGDEDIPMTLYTALYLTEFFPHYKSIKYNYDFGDGWQHEVEFEALITDYDKNYPVCIDREGATPPEDVGGEGGYLEFL